jgi:signal transduction histidine kinase
MHRIRNDRSQQNVQVLIALTVLGSAALACVVVALWITRALQADVTAIQTHLANLERNLTVPITKDVQVSELSGIMAGIDHLAASLREKIEDEKKLIDQLHHQERLASLGQVAAGVAHELRNPLAVIRLRAQMLLRPEGTAQIAQSSKLIVAKTERLSKLIERLLFLAKPIRLNFVRFDCTALCGEVMAAKQAEAEALKIDLHLERTEPAFACGDPFRLRQVLENLISNALECFDGSSSPEKIVSVEIALTAEQLLITVRDTGPGLADAAAQRAFEPFFTTKSIGTGLGLPIAREIVRTHGGELTLRSGMERGVIAEITLPQTNAGTGCAEPADLSEAIA